MRSSITKQQEYSRNEPKVVLKLLAQTGGVSFICIGGATAIGIMVGRLNHTGLLFALIGATIGLGVAMVYIYYSFKRINNK
ncbi:hypothetical protein ES706_02916 [subsurface metagenome]